MIQLEGEREKKAVIYCLRRYVLIHGESKDDDFYFDKAPFVKAVGLIKSHEGSSITISGFLSNIIIKSLADIWLSREIDDCNYRNEIEKLLEE